MFPIKKKAACPRLYLVLVRVVLFCGAATTTTMLLTAVDGYRRKSRKLCFCNILNNIFDVLLSTLFNRAKIMKNFHFMNLNARIVGGFWALMTEITAALNDTSLIGRKKWKY